VSRVIDHQDDDSLNSFSILLVLFFSRSIWTAIKQAWSKTQPDPHWQAMQKYKEVPHWWYGLLFFLAFTTGLIVCAKGDTTLPIYAYVVAIILGVFMAPFSCILCASMGTGPSTSLISKMIGGALLPGEIFASRSY